MCTTYENRNPLGKYFGKEAIEIIPLLKRYPNVIKVAKESLKSSYNQYFGYTGVAFIEKYFCMLNHELASCNLKKIEKLFIFSKKLFHELGLKDIYENRIKDLVVSDNYNRLDSTIYRGCVLDFGAGDNRFGRYILNRFPGVSSVIGVDIARNDSAFTGPRLSFNVQKNPYSINFEDGSFDLITHVTQSIVVCSSFLVL